MSGGHWNYADSTLKSEIFSWSNEPWNALEDREISELVWDVLELIHSFDWYQSGDTGKEDYLEDKAAFKKKWFSNRGVRIRQTIDNAVDELRKELYETYGLEEKDEATT